MVGSIAANLIADLIWAPVVWLAVREWHQHRRLLDEAKAMISALHDRLDAVAGPADDRDWEDV